MTRIEDDAGNPDTSLDRPRPPSLLQPFMMGLKTPHCKQASKVTAVDPVCRAYHCIDGTQMRGLGDLTVAEVYCPIPTITDSKTDAPYSPYLDVFKANTRFRPVYRYGIIKFVCLPHGSTELSLLFAHVETAGIRVLVGKC